MFLNSDDFSKCGFPEEYLFWLLFLDGIIVFFSFLFLHGYVNEKCKKYGFYPVLFLLPFKNAFIGHGKLLRVVFIISAVLLLVILLVFYLGYSTGGFDCGKIFSTN